jgi:hypothetical protein
MTIFHLTIRNVNRADGRSAVGAAAYCSRSRLYEGRAAKILPGELEAGEYFFELRLDAAGGQQVTVRSGRLIARSSSPLAAG